MKIALSIEECREAIADFLEKQGVKIDKSKIQFEVKTDRFSGNIFAGAYVDIEAKE